METYRQDEQDAEFVAEELASGPIRDFRDLRVWQAAMSLAEAVYRATEPFPKREIYGMADQLRRAAVSIPSNVAEGHGRRTRQDYTNFLSIAQGSSAELLTQVMLAGRVGLLDENTRSQLEEAAINLRRQLHALQRALARA